MEWETVIGLEVHAQLQTRSKIFEGTATTYGAPPNTQAGLLSLGMPGTLPILNKEAVRLAVRFGLGVQANIAEKSIFARKNYFYPDLPKGYQISQYEAPIVSEGYLDIILDAQTEKRIRIQRAHLEEDAGKSIHEGFQGHSGIDLNRAGVPLLEIVSYPDLASAKEAVVYLKMLHSLLRYLDVCDGNMQEGSFRCDANVSIRPKGEKKLGIRTEIKNINSFRFVERAIDYEVERQICVLTSGGQLYQETRLYDAQKNETRLMRSKEEAHDYRYFPDPDLLPLRIDAHFIAAIRATLPELPQAKRLRFERFAEISSEDAAYLTADKEIAHYFESLIAYDISPKLAANWIMGELSAALNAHELEITQSPVNSQRLAQLLKRIQDHTISGKIAKMVFEVMWTSTLSADEIIASRGLQQVTDTASIEKAIAEVILRYPEQVAEYRAGKEKILGFLVGQVMKLSDGKMNPTQLNTLLKQQLKQ